MGEVAVFDSCGHSRQSRLSLVEKLEEANADIEAQDFQAESINWWYATR